jgi:hypothetical protein
MMIAPVMVLTFNELNQDHDDKAKHNKGDLQKKAICCEFSTTCG